MTLDNDKTGGGSCLTARVIIWNQPPFPMGAINDESTLMVCENLNAKRDLRPRVART